MENEQAIACFVCQKILNSVSALQSHLEKEHGDGSNIEMGAGAFQMDRDEKPELEIHEKLVLPGYESCDQNCKESITEGRPSQASHVQTSKAVRADVTKGTTVSNPAVQFQDNPSTSDSDDYNAQEEGLENESLSSDSCGSPGKRQYGRREKVVLKKLPLCEECGTAFTTKANFETHLNTCPGIVSETQKTQQAENQNSSKTQFQELSRNFQSNVCPICGKNFRSHEGLIYHKTTHNASRTRPYACSKCGKSYYIKTHLNDHILSRHPDMMHFKCNTCGKMFMDKKALDRHLRCSCKFKAIEHKHLMPEAKEEETEVSEIKSKRKIYEGNTTARQRRSYVCSLCGKNFRSREGLIYHNTTHNVSRTRPYACSKCGKSYYRKTHLNEHILSSHPEMMHFKCNTCGKMYMDKKALDRHSQYSCRISFKVKTIEDGQMMPEAKQNEDEVSEIESEREINDRIVTGQPRLPSDSMDREIEQNEVKYDEKNACESQTSEECKVQTRENEAICEDEPKPLDEVLTGNKKEKTCGICGKAFTHSSNLIRHMSTHNSSRPRPHSCDQCGKSYYNTSQLKEHIDNAHLKKFRFECKACGKIFAQSHLLNHHRKSLCKMLTTTKIANNAQLEPEASKARETWTKENALKQKACECPICGKILSNYWGLCYHIKTHNSSRPRPYSCDHCEKGFYQKNHLKAHVDSFHLQLFSFQCKICGKRFSQSFGLSQHLKMSCRKPTHIKDAEKSRLESKEKEEVGGNEDNEAHIHHGTEDNKCLAETRIEDIEQMKEYEVICEDELHSLVKVQKEEVGDGGNEYKEASIPNQAEDDKYPGKTQYRRKENVLKKLPSCEVCGTAFTSKPDFETHLNTCPGIVRKTQKIQQEEKQNSSSIHFKKLSRKVQCSVAYVHVCPICGKKLRSRAGLIYHKTTHNASRTRPHACSKCGQRYYRKTHLNYHIFANHRDMMHFKCKTCGKMYMDKKALYRHSQYSCSMSLKVKAIENRQRMPEVKQKEDAASKMESEREMNDRIVTEQPRLPSDSKDREIYQNEVEYDDRSACESQTSEEGTVQKRENGTICEDESIHNSSRRRPHSCDQCGKSYYQQSHLKEHIDIAHLKLFCFECKACGKKYARSHRLNHHRKYSCKMLTRTEKDNVLPEQAHKEKVYECPICGKNFKTNYGYHYHRRTHYSSRPRPHSCDRCEKSYYIKSHLKEHVDSAHLKLFRFECKACGKKFLRSNGLSQHLKESCKKSLKMDESEKRLLVSKQKEEVEERGNEGNEAYIHHGTEDDKCPAKTSNEDILQKKENEVICENEPKPLVNVFTDLKENQKEMTQDALISNSGKSSSKEDVEEHVKTCKQKVYECQVCGNNFRSYNRWFNHKRMHDSSKPHPHACSKCTKRYRTKTSLKKHIVRNHPETTHFKCNNCGKKYVEKHLFIRHLQRLCKQNQYSCSVCEKSFQTFYLLRCHRERHDSSRPRPHACDQCGKRFHTKNGLQCHIISAHLVPHPVQCGASGHTYPRQSDLNRPLKDSCKISTRMEEAGDMQRTPKEATERETLELGTGGNCTIKETTVAAEGNIEDENKNITQTETLGKVVFSQPSQQCKQTVYSCKIDEKEYHTKDELRNHMETHNQRGQNYICDYCGEQFLKRRTLIVHIKILHPDIFHVKCDACGKTFSNKCDFDQHVCSMSLEKSEGRLTQEKSKDDEYPYNCSECGKEFLWRSYFEKHMQMHNPTRPRPFTCKKCGKGMFTKYCLETHMENFHFMVRIKSEDDAQQKACGQKCRELEQDHNSISNSVGATNSSISYDELEIKKRSDNSHYQCPLCEYSDKNQVALRHHIRRCHTTQDRFLCDICGRCCFTKSALKSHSRTHAPSIKKYKCEICGKTFKTGPQMSRHANRHEGEKRFKCNLCDYRCVEKGYLRVHMKSHSKDKPYTCEVCHKAFKRRENLKHHKRIHTGEKPFVCDVCKEGFTHSAGLYLHKTRKEKCGHSG